MSGDSTALKLKMNSTQRTTGNDQFSIDETSTWLTESVEEVPENSKDKKLELVIQKTTVEISVHQETPTTPPAHSFSPTTIITTSSSVDTLNGETLGLSALSGPSSPSNLSSITLVGSTGSGTAPNENDKDDRTEVTLQFKYTKAPTSPLPERKRKPSAQENGKSEGSRTEPKVETSTSQKSPEFFDTMKNVKISEAVSISSKPKIVSAVAKTGLRDEGIKSAQCSPIKFSSNVLQPMSYLTMNRRPSAGTIGVPVAALSQHRRSLQLNSSEGGFGIPKVAIQLKYQTSTSMVLLITFIFYVLFIGF